MNKQLVELANKAGFKSAMFTDTDWKHSNKEDLRWYLWVCELRRWFRKEHKLLIETFRTFEGALEQYHYRVVYDDGVACSWSYYEDELNEANCNDEVIIETALLSIFTVDKNLLLKRGINLNL